MKKIMSGKSSANSGWQKWGDNDYVAPLIEWPNGFVAEKEVREEFCQEIGIGETSYLSDQNWQKDREGEDSQKCDVTDPSFLSNLMGLTSGFSQLINGGSKIQPQVVHGVWLDSEKRVLSVNVKELKKGVGELAGENIKALLKSSNPPGTRELIFVEAFNSSAEIEEEIDIDGVSSAHENDTIAKEVSPAEKRGNSILLGGTLKGEPQLTLGLIVEGARVNTEESSPFRKFAYEILDKGKKLLVKNIRNSGGTPKALTYQEAFVKWSKGQKNTSTSGETATHVESQDVMPDIRGLSLRKAFQEINGFDLNISVQGAGKIVRQSIKPGSKITKNQNLVLELKF
nr:PASTA domain-containing protein [Desulfobulbaceae bacterium]